MPLTFTLAEGVLPKGSEKAAFQKLSDAMISCTDCKATKS